jgi:hypothetical protein
MQAAGMVNDHLAGCLIYKRLVGDKSAVVNRKS